MITQIEINQYVNINTVRTILRLDEEHFMQFDDFISDINELKNTKDFNYIEFVKACKIILQREEGTIFHKRKLYKAFAQKYEFLLNYFFDNNFDICWDIFGGPFYKYLKENIEQKEHFLAIIEKLCEFRNTLFYIQFSPNADLDGDYRFANNIWEKAGLATDGHITWLPQISCNYPVHIEGANYILEYSKSKKGWDSHYASMKCKNLSFDIDTLPSCEMLSDFNVDLPIDFETVKQKTEGINRIEKLEDASTEAKNLLHTLEVLTKKLEHCENKEEVKAILSKIEIIKELYRDINALELLLYEDVINQGMTKEEIRKTLIKRRLNRNNCCC